MQEKELIRLIVENPSAGMEKAIDLYGGAVKKICKAYLPGITNEDLEEVISDCFVALWQSVEQFDETRNVSLKTYFYGIVRMQAKNKRRKLAIHTKKQEVELDVVEELADPMLTEEVVENKILAEFAKDMIAHMDPPDDRIFQLRYMEQYSEREIAESLRMTVKAIERRIARGKKKLQKQLRVFMSV